MLISGLELLGVCHLFDRSCGDIMFLVFQVTSCEHMFKGLCEFMVGQFS